MQQRRLLPDGDSQFPVSSEDNFSLSVCSWSWFITTPSPGGGTCRLLTLYTTTWSIWRCVRTAGRCTPKLYSPSLIAEIWSESFTTFSATGRHLKDLPMSIDRPRGTPCLPLIWSPARMRMPCLQSQMGIWGWRWDTELLCLRSPLSSSTPAVTPFWKLTLKDRCWWIIIKYMNNLQLEHILHRALGGVFCILHFLSNSQGSRIIR